MFVETLDTLVYVLSLLEVQKKIIKVLEESEITYTSWSDLQYLLKTYINESLTRKQKENPTAAHDEQITYEDVVTNAASHSHIEEFFYR